MFALLSPELLNALHLYMPASLRVGFLILNVSKNLFFFPFLHSQVMRASSLMTLSFLYQVISGKGLASKMHSRIKSSPSCLIEGFLGNRGGIPSGILGLSPPEPEKHLEKAWSWPENRWCKWTLFFVCLHRSATKEITQWLILSRFADDACYLEKELISKVNLLFTR